MQLLISANGRQAAIVMESAGSQVVTVGEYRYRPAEMARSVRRLAGGMWGSSLDPDILDHRLTFEAPNDSRASGPWTDSGSFSPRSGSLVTLGRWDEQGSVGIALHELAHEMHLRAGGYDASDGVLREAVSLMAEREAGLSRSFEREPYYTASHLVNQLMELPAFARMAFPQRWAELMELSNDVALSDLTTYYLNRSERLGLERWLKRRNADGEQQDWLLGKVAAVALRYSLDLRRRLIGCIVRCAPDIPPDQLAYVLDSIMTLDRRYPGDDLGRIIDFCFAPHARQRRGVFAVS